MRKELSGSFFATICLVAFFASPAQSQDLAASTTSRVAGPTPASAVIAESKPFFLRFSDTPTQPAGPDPARRGFAAPLDSTPFPGGDYSVGGAPVIGAPDTQSYMLMQAMNENHSRVKVYGWLNGGFNVITSNMGDGANSPAAYYLNPNRVTPDRPEIHLEHSYDLAAYDLGTEKTPFIVAAI
jgi:hypothetical protein